MTAKFAQHFLTNRHAIERIADALEINPEDGILEIGPGKGALTGLLLGARRIIVIEIDERMVAALRQKFGSRSNLEIVNEDVLKIDFVHLFETPLPSLSPEGRGANSKIVPSPILGEGGRRPGEGLRIKVVGNLPYNLTSPILRKLSKWSGWSFALLMVQKEVGDRLCAAVGTSEYGALTVGMSLTCMAERVFDLSETSFEPAPKVRSSVVKLIRRPEPLTSDIAGAQRVIQAAFQQRRKTILNSLSHGLGLSRQTVQTLLEKAKIDPGIRPERLSSSQFTDLSKFLQSSLARS